MLRRAGNSKFLLPLFGYVIDNVTHSSRGIQFKSGNAVRQNIPFNLVTGIEVSSGMFWTRLNVNYDGGPTVKIVGVDRDGANEFATSARVNWKYELRRLVDEKRGRILVEAQKLEELDRPTSYLAASDGTELHEAVQTALREFPSKFPEDVLAADERDAIGRIRRFLAAPSNFRDGANRKFISAEITQKKIYFDSIESDPLTPEQREAVVTDENATLILAAAGSGKTSVIVSKAGYLVETKRRQPEEILLLSFARKAADEMTERVKKRTGHDIEATTFHALGLAIIGQAENRKPALAAHADDDKQLLKLLRDILKTLIEQDSQFETISRRWFAEYFAPDRNEFDFKELSQYFQYVRAVELRTLQGEKVKSFEEFEIANFLYLNGVAYEYEPDYEHDTASSEKRVYTPDFRLSDSGVYIEHFGVGKETGPDGQERWVTASYIDRDKYVADMEWKVALHQRHRTPLIKTYSYMKSEGRLSICLSEQLSNHGVELLPIAADEYFGKLLELGQIDQFTRTVATFLHHFKSAELDRAQCLIRAGSGRMKARNIAFLDVFIPLFDGYQKSLGSRIDFEDMIIRASRHVEEGNYRSPYRHLLVDEFQDISFGRARLLKALLGQHSHSRLFAVGDDWQSIYRFAGSDLSIMRNFGKHFGRTFDGRDGIRATVDLGRTFRCVDKIAEPAKRFVLKNDQQIDKRVEPAGRSKKPALRVVFGDANDVPQIICEILEDIQSREDGTQQKVQLLGRYNHLKPNYLRSLVDKYPAIDLGFLTIHGSKGLECDHTIVLGMDSGTWGFPSEIVDDPVLNMVLPESEEFPNAEERRLFYVALTRAKKSVYLVANSSRPSVFIDELVEGEEYDTEIIGKLQFAPGRCAKCGGRMLRKQGAKGPYFVCEFGNLCGNRSPACPDCGVGLPTPQNGSQHVMTCSCGAEHPVCDECGQGWLIKRVGRFGEFMGCSRYPKCLGARQRRTKME